MGTNFGLQCLVQLIFALGSSAMKDGAVLNDKNVE